MKFPDSNRFLDFLPGVSVRVVQDANRRPDLRCPIRTCPGTTSDPLPHTSIGGWYCTSADEIEHPSFHSTSRLHSPRPNRCAGSPTTSSPTENATLADGLDSSDAITSHVRARSHRSKHVIHLLRNSLRRRRHRTDSHSSERIQYTTDGSDPARCTTKKPPTISVARNRSPTNEKQKDRRELNPAIGIHGSGGRQRPGPNQYAWDEAGERVRAA